MKTRTGILIQYTSKCAGHVGVLKVRIHVPVFTKFSPFFIKICSALMTQSRSSSNSFALEPLSQPFLITPFEQFKELWGVTSTDRPQNSLHLRSWSDSSAVFTWIMRESAVRSILPMVFTLRVFSCFQILPLERSASLFRSSLMGFIDKYGIKLLGLSHIDLKRAALAPIPSLLLLLFLFGFLLLFVGSSSRETGGRPWLAAHAGGFELAIEFGYGKFTTQTPANPPGSSNKGFRADVQRIYSWSCVA